jgi:ABC-type nickel/cobalt efflux system permease component RcnA
MLGVIAISTGARTLGTYVSDLRERGQTEERCNIVISLPHFTHSSHHITVITGILLLNYRLVQPWRPCRKNCWRPPQLARKNQKQLKQKAFFHHHHHHHHYQHQQRKLQEAIWNPYTLIYSNSKYRARTCLHIVY